MVAPSAATNGIMLTPVSKPDRPSTSKGNATIAGHTMPPRPPPPDVNASVHPDIAPGVVKISNRPTATTTALRPRNATTSGTATPIASVKPSRNTPPRTSSSTTVMATACPCSAPGASGFSIKCTLASAADKVIVTIHDVATNPNNTSTNTLPRQNGKSRSNIATDPCPCGLSRATRQYIGNIPSSVSATINRVASGDKAPAAKAAIPGRYANVEK